jgi:hypothetical protein
LAVIAATGEKVQMLVSVVALEACEPDIRLRYSAGGAKINVKISWRSDLEIPLFAQTAKVGHPPAGMPSLENHEGWGKRFVVLHEAPRMGQFLLEWQRKAPLLAKNARNGAPGFCPGRGEPNAS